MLCRNGQDILAESRADLSEWLEPWTTPQVTSGTRTFGLQRLVRASTSWNVEHPTKDLEANAIFTWARYTTPTGPSCQIYWELARKSAGVRKWTLSLILVWGHGEIGKRSQRRHTHLAQVRHNNQRNREARDFYSIVASVSSTSKCGCRRRDAVKVCVCVVLEKKSCHAINLKDQPGGSDFWNTSRL